MMRNKTRTAKARNKSKCKYCGGRKFNITIRAFQRIEYNRKGEIIYADTFDFGDMIESEGYSCVGCGMELKSNEVIS